MTEPRFPSRRFAQYAGRGAVGTSHHLASQAGLAALRDGGNAVDAAITAAACLVVLEPESCGIGGDAFAIVSTPDGLAGLNASGPAGSAADGEFLRRKGFESMPDIGIHSVTVPGVPAAWEALTKRYGRRSLAQNLEAAIAFARDGFIVSAVQHESLARGFAEFRALGLGGQGEFGTWVQALCPNGVPAAGDRHRLPWHAASLEALAADGAAGFYRGDTADMIDIFSRALDGALRRSDWERYQPEWVDPVSVRYRGYDVWELPPNGQGLVALMALNILSGFEFGRKDALAWHRAIEAVKLAFSDGLAYIADPDYMTVSVEDLLSEGYAAQRRSLITDRALTPSPGNPPEGGTVYVNAADEDGLMISFIQSLGSAHGSGLFIPFTGIGLQSRARNFSLDPKHPNHLSPGKRPFHTIIPGFLTLDGEPVGPFGVMGGHMQPQGHTQVIMNAIDFGCDPQEALDAPRFRWDSGLAVSVEAGAGSQILDDLAKRGHEITVTEMDSLYGHGQIIWRDGDGYVGGTEPRIDGAMAMY